MRSAREDYASALEEVEHKLKLLSLEIKKHEKAFQASGETNWGFVGDLTTMEEYLRNAMNRLYVDARNRR